MYIQNKTKKYLCAGYFSTPQTVSFTGVERLTLPISGEIKLVSEDNDLVLATQDCGDYARQVYENGVLTLTNEAEPVPEPTPEPQPQPPSTADMAEAMIDLDTRVSMLEMGVK